MRMVTGCPSGPVGVEAEDRALYDSVGFGDSFER